MKGSGKTILAQDAVIKLRKEGIPTAYIQVGENDEVSFLKNCGEAFGIVDENLEWTAVTKVVKVKMKMEM